MNASRQRWFCRFCGQLTIYSDSVCKGHRDLIALDDATGAGLESRVQMGHHRKPRCQACEGRGTEVGDLECPNCNGTGLAPAGRRRILPPANGSGA